MVDEYAPIKKIILDTVKMLAETRTFNVNLFLNQMEGAFKSAGFRETGNNTAIKSILLLRIDAAGVSERLHYVGCRRKNFQAG